MSAQTVCSGAVQVTLTGTAGRTVGTLQAPSVAINLSKALSLTVGSGAAQADILYAATHALTGTTPLALAIGDGSLTDAFGVAIDVASIRAILVINNCDSATKTIEILGGVGDVASMVTGAIGTNGPSIRGLGGAVLYMVGATDAAGWAVAGTETFTITPTATGSCDVYIFGTSA